MVQFKAAQSLSNADPVKVVRGTRRGIVVFCVIAIALIAACLASFELYIFTTDQGDRYFWPLWAPLVIIYLLTLVCRRWLRARWVAANDKVERDFDFDWYDRYLEAYVSQHRRGLAHRRAVALYWGARAKMVYMRGDFTQVFADLDRVDLRAFSPGRYALSAIDCYALGHNAALLTGDKNKMTWYYLALLEYPVIGSKRTTAKQNVLGELFWRDFMVNDGPPPEGSRQRDELAERPTAFARMEESYFLGLAEYRQGNVAQTESLMRRVVQLGHGNPEIYYVRQAQTRLSGNGV